MVMAPAPATTGPPVDQWPPWPSPSQWREANAAIAHLMALYQIPLKPPFPKGDLQHRAFSIGSAIEALFPTMERLCRRTCPKCEQPCCQVAKPWFDLRDLLFLHLTDRAMAPSQPIRNNRDHCRYISERGCTLPRIERPWICTWYLCPTQTQIMRGEDAEAARTVEEPLKWIGFQRKRLEVEWINVSVKY